MPIPGDYAERVYAGVLGKIIGVYLGRPFEGWTYERIMAELGEIYYYVNERRDLPLKNNRSSSPTTTSPAPSPSCAPCPTTATARTSPRPRSARPGSTTSSSGARSCGGAAWATPPSTPPICGSSTASPRRESGSIALNGKVVAEQIGAQIFIDGWAMVAPGDPELAADLARRAASVSHDGEAIYGAQVMAAMEAQAFVESRHRQAARHGRLPHPARIP